MKGIGIQLSDSPAGVANIDLKVDVIRDANNLIVQGLCVGNTVPQNQAVIMIANPGEFMFNPTIGVAIDELILSSDYLRIRHRTREHFTKDGMKVKYLQFDQDNPLLIDAPYE